MDMNIFLETSDNVAKLITVLVMNPNAKVETSKHYFPDISAEDILIIENGIEISKVPIPDSEILDIAINSVCLRFYKVKRVIDKTLPLINFEIIENTDDAILNTTITDDGKCDYYQICEIISEYKEEDYVLKLKYCDSDTPNEMQETLASFKDFKRFWKPLEVAFLKIDKTSVIALIQESSDLLSYLDGEADDNTSNVTFGTTMINFCTYALNGEFDGF